MLDSRAMEATLEAVIRFAAEAREMDAPLKGVLATEAIRVAANSADLTAKVEQELGVPVTVITGEEEAALGWRAITQDYAALEGALGVIDIGGGSNTLSVGTAREWSSQMVLSLPLGARELTRRYGLHKPVEYSKSLGNLASLSIEIHAPVTAMHPRPQSCVVIGGTASVFAGVYAHLEGERLPDSTPLNRDWLASVFMRVAALPQERRAELGVPPDLSDIAPAGAAILLVLLDTWGLRQFSLSERNILDGYLLS